MESHNLIHRLSVMAMDDSKAGQFAKDLHQLFVSMENRIHSLVSENISMKSKIYSLVNELKENKNCNAHLAEIKKLNGIIKHLKNLNKKPHGGFDSKKQKRIQEINEKADYIQKLKDEMESVIDILELRIKETKG
jgi:hypothetical protein